MANLDPSTVKWDDEPAGIKWDAAPSSIKWDAPASLGEAMQPDVFTEGAAQAAAPPSPGLGNEIQRGLLTGGRGLALANAGLYELASPVLSDEAKARLQEPSFALAHRLKQQQDAIPASDIGSQMVGGLVSGPAAMFGQAPSRGQDIIEQGGTPAQAANVANLSLASELPALALPGLGSSIPARVGLQGLAGGALAAGGHLAENAVLPPNLQTPLTVPEVAQAAGGAGMFGLIPHAPEAAPQTPAEVAALRGAPEPETPNAAPVGPELPAQVPVSDAGERPPVVPDVPGAAESATGAPADFAAQLATDGHAVAPEDVGDAHTVAQLAAVADRAGLEPADIAQRPDETSPEHVARVAQDVDAADKISTLAERAADAGLDPQSIERFNGETDAEYIDRTTGELTQWEQQHANDATDQPDNRADLRPQTGADVATAGAGSGEPETADTGQAQGTGVPRQADAGLQPAADTEALGQAVEAPERPVEAEPAAASITKADVNASREQRGLEPIENVNKLSNQEALDRAQAEIAHDPTVARRTTDELIANPEAADPVKKAILAHDRQRIETDLRAAADEVAKAPDENSRAAAIVKRDLADLDLELNDRATRATGTASGQSLQSQKIAVLPDYSLSRVLTAAKEAAKGKLPETVRADLEAATARIAELEAKLAKRAKSEPTVKKTPDEKMQARVKAQIDKLEGQIKQRLSACPI